MSNTLLVAAQCAGAWAANAAALKARSSSFGACSKPAAEYSRQACLADSLCHRWSCSWCQSLCSQLTLITTICCAALQSCFCLFSCMLGKTGPCLATSCSYVCGSDEQPQALLGVVLREHVKIERRYCKEPLFVSQSRRKGQL